MCHAAKCLMCDTPRGNQLINLLAVVKALDAPEHEVLAVVKEGAVVRLPKAGVCPVHAILPVVGTSLMVLDVVIVLLAKLSQRSDGYLAGQFTGTEALVMDDLMVPQIEAVVLVTGARGNKVIPRL